MKKKIPVFIFALVLIMCSFVQAAFAEAKTDAGRQEPAKRTILLYCCGSNLESSSAMASFNFEQILASHFSSDDDINVIVMTGGSSMWQLDDDDDFANDNKYLAFPDGVNVPDDAVQVTLPGTDVVVPIDNNKSAISCIYNQVWEARGIDAVDENGKKDPNAGKLVCLDGDGLTGATSKAVKNEDELMTDPETLRAFINYGAANYPAEKYDLILWDHGGGPQGGYGHDENYNKKKKYPAGIDYVMSFEGIVDALKDNAVVDKNSDGRQDGKFDFINFDACLMGNLELSFVLSDYTKYYIASAETEPGYGQYYGPHDKKNNYKGWLDELGNSSMDAVYNAEDGSYALGKVIVDDMYEFYSNENSPGKDRTATLAVYDTEKMINNTEFMSVLTELSSQLKAEAEGDGGSFAFYDELRGFFKSINYSDSKLFDLADAAAFLGVRDIERSENTGSSGTIDYTTPYTGIAKRFAKLFPHGETGNIVENDFMYAKCTISEKTAAGYHYSEGSDYEMNYGILFSTGLTVFFPDASEPSASVGYFEAMDPVLAGMPVKNDGRYEFLKNHEEVVADYGTILFTGASIGNILHGEQTFYPDNNPYLGDKSRVNPDVLLKYWKNKDNNTWDAVVSVNLSKRSAGVQGSMPWLNKLITRMIEDAMMPEGIDVTEIRHEGMSGYRVEINQGNSTIFQSVEQNIVAELPVLKSYLESLSGKSKRLAMSYGSFAIGQIPGYNDKDNIWEIEPFDEKWYAINDAKGNKHVASIYAVKNNRIGVPVLFGTSEDGKNADRLIMLEFENTADKKGSHVLRSMYFFNSSSGPMRIDPARLTLEYTLTPIIYVSQPSGNRKFYMPISKSTFVINKKNASSITLDMTDLSNIPDIEDTTGDGKSFTRTFTVTDLYGDAMNITERVVGSLTHISRAGVEAAEYTGKELTPKVICDGKTLAEGVDYTWEKVPDIIGEGENEKYTIPKFKNAGTYEVLLTGRGEYTGFCNTPFVIRKAANTLKVTGKTVKLSRNKLRNSSVTLAASKVLKYTEKGQGRRTFTRISKGKKYKNIKINKKNGKITLKKGLKKGTYKLKIKVRAKGNSNHKAAAKTVTVTFRIK